MNPESEQEAKSSSSGTSSGISFADTQLIDPSTSRTFEEGKQSVTPSENQEESNVKVFPSLQSRIEKRHPGTNRQLHLTGFKFENSLRNLVLSLSDSLDRLERQWQHKLLVKIAKIEYWLVNRSEDLAIYLTDYSPDSMSDTREYEYRNENSWLSAGENTLLRQILTRLYSQSQAADFCPVSGKIDYGKEHLEIFHDVIYNQGDKKERQAFLESCLRLLPQWKFQKKRPSEKEDPEFEAKLKKVEIMLQKAMELLENDEYAAKQKKLIRQTSNSIKYSKSMFDNKIKSHSLEDPGWPIVDYIFTDGWLLVQIILGNKRLIAGQGWSSDKLRIDSNGKDMLVAGNGKNPFQKYFTLPFEIDPKKVTARFEDFILQIKCVPASREKQ